jgi:pimeloyl-ACP methyl ester carboxylesterase
MLRQATAQCGGQDLRQKAHTTVGNSAQLRERVGALIPNSRLTIIEETSHYPQLEQPQELVKIIAQFVEEIA